MSRGLNQMYGMTLESYWATDRDYVSIWIAHLDDDMAGLFGTTAGLYVSFTRSVGDIENTVAQNVAIDPADITGDVLLRMSYDDAADELSAAFSLDGGTTFQAPFASVASDLKMDDSSEWYLDAQELQIPEPATMSLLGIGVLALIRRRRVRPGLLVAPDRRHDPSRQLRRPAGQRAGRGWPASTVTMKKRRRICNASTPPCSTAWPTIRS